MKYEVRFPNRSAEKKFKKSLDSVHEPTICEEIKNEVLKLADNPYPYNQNNPKYFKKLKPPIQFFQLVAQYRIRIRDYRVLYDVDDKKKIVWVLALRRRSEKTYR